MAKDLEFTAEVASDLSSSVRKDEALKRLIDAWNSKSARAGMRVGTFGFMAAALAACGGGGSGAGDNGGADNGSDDNGDGSVSEIFRLLTGTASALEIQTLTVNAGSAIESTLAVDDLVGAPDSPIDASLGLVIPAGHVYLGDISLFDDAGYGIEVTGAGSLWILVPAEGFTDEILNRPGFTGDL
jgi:hypothetical protein